MPLARAARRRHLLLRLLQVHDLRADLGIDAARERERLAVARVEALGDVARELDVLALVDPDRDDVGLVEEDVARLEHRVGEEAGRHEVLRLRLLLELRHPTELAEARDRRQQPIGLRVRGDVALREDRRPLRIEARRDEHREQVERPLAQVRGVVLDADRVQVDDAEERLALLLRRGVLAEPAGVVAEVLHARRLDPGEDAHRGIVPGPARRRRADSRLARCESSPSPPSTVMSPCPGDKSISHRAVLIGALCDGETRVSGFGRSADTEATIAAVRALGAEVIEEDVDTLRVRGAGLRGLRAPEDAIDCGNAGTLMRLLAGVLAGQEGRTELVGDSSLSSRPMERIAEPLRRMGATSRRPRVTRRSSCSGAPLRAIDYELPVASAQVKSAILLAGVQATGATTVVEPVRDARPHGAHARACRRARDAEAVERDGRGRRVAASARRRGPRRHLVRSAVPRGGRDRPGVGRDGARRGTQPSPRGAAGRARAHGRARRDLQPALDRRRAGRATSRFARRTSSGRRSRRRRSRR